MYHTLRYFPARKQAVYSVKGETRKREERKKSGASKQTLDFVRSSWTNRSRIEFSCRRCNSIRELSSLLASFDLVSLTVHKSLCPRCGHFVTVFAAFYPWPKGKVMSTNRGEKPREKLQWSKLRKASLSLQNLSIDFFPTRCTRYRDVSPHRLAN